MSEERKIKLGKKNSYFSKVTEDEKSSKEGKNLHFSRCTVEFGPQDDLVLPVAI